VNNLVQKTSSNALTIELSHMDKSHITDEDSSPEVIKAKNASRTLESYSYTNDNEDLSKSIDYFSVINKLKK
jgi:hypothetical protein